MKGFAILAFLIFSSIVAYLGYDFCVAPNPTLKIETIVDLPPGTSFVSMLRILHAQGIEIPDFEAKVSAKVFKLDRKIKAGEYQLSPQLSSLGILKTLAFSKGLQHNLLVKEGYNRWDIVADWKDLDPRFDAKAFQKILSSDELLKKMKVPSEAEIVSVTNIKMPDGSAPKNFRTLEGYLFPETYSFQKYDSIKTIVEEMLSQFDGRARPILERHPWGQNALGLYRLLTLASIIEKESGNGEEQPLVSSVFWNRLNKKMRLQSDPTTIYGLMPNYDGKLHKTNLESFSIFNTYSIPELPVGPICNPGEKALRAVVQPAASDFLYFVSKGNGSHIFSKTYDEHTKNVRTFQLKH